MESILAHLRLQQYKQTFQKHNVDFVTFLEMNEQSLKNIGIKNDQHINILMSCVGKLKAILLTTLSGQTSPTTTLENREETKVLDELYLFDTMKVDLNGEGLPRPNEEFLAVQASNQYVTQADGGTAVRGVEVGQSTVALQDLTIGGYAEGSSSPKAEPIEPPAIIIAVYPESSTPNNERSTMTRFTRLRRQNISATDDVNAIGKDRSIRFKNKTWQVSILAFPRNPPSYYDAVERLRGVKPTCSDQEEGQEKLPPYSCTVEKKGYVIKKNEMTSHRRANDRSWRKIYLHLYGTLINVYKSEPTNIKQATLLHQSSMDNAAISLATDYSKRRNVIRIKFSNGDRCLIQTSNRSECINWVESLQTAVNISSTIDDRKMPQFITAPNRRRRTYGYYAEMTRELQQIPFDELDDAQILNW